MAELAFHTERFTPSPVKLSINAVFTSTSNTGSPSVYQQEPPLLDETSNLNIFGMNNECLAQLAADWLEKHGVRGFFSGSTQLAHTAVAFTARIHGSSNAFEIPRPHHDGDDVPYWNASSGEDIIKLGTVLVGPGTIFYHVADNDPLHDVVNKGAQEQRDAGKSEYQVRRWVADHFDNVPTTQLRVGELGAWRVGTKYTSAIHSEPSTSDANRVLSVNGVICKALHC
ncbi:hypothetical protein EMMF5_001584 [Cystobasidiomycetes sp. EMM_F5]